MRADRLISLIMLLETKGPLTAEELAQELEVSQRTIYRDIDALCMAGIPVYGTQGPDGGYRLVEGYRSYLNSLNKDEVLALLSFNLPEHFDQSEFGAKLKGALLKMRSSYTHLANGEEALAERLYIDSTGWEKNDKNKTDNVPIFNAIYRAVYQNCKLEITYSHPIHKAYTLQKIVDPYGVVAKENMWHLVYGSQEKVRVLEISTIIQVEELEEYFPYPKGFQLKEFWQDWCAEVGAQYSSFKVKALVPEQLKSVFASYLKKGKVPFSPLPISYDEQVWCEIDLLFESFEVARSKLLSFGGAVKVLEPIALQYSLRDFAEQIQKLYEDI